MGEMINLDRNPFANSAINNESVVQQVINRITDAIISGALKPGDQLPPEMELISTFGVSRNSLRSAIQTLRAYGVLEVRRPEGTFVRRGASPELLNPMLYSLILHKDDSYKDITGLREMIDFGISRLVIENGLTAEETETLESVYDELVYELRKEQYDLKKIADTDKKFHQCVAKASHNSMAEMLSEFLLNITAESRARTIRNVFDANDREYLVKTHRLHLDALEGKPGLSLDEVLEFSYYYWKDAVK